MVFQRKRTSPLLFLLPALAISALASPAPPTSRSDAVLPSRLPETSSPASDSTPRLKYNIGTKDAPVDGKDGKPHEGPFVEMENWRISAGADNDSKSLRLNDDQSADSAHADDLGLVENNIGGVMDDKNRPEPKVGTTGTDGGVSEKDKARKAHEDMSGAKMESRPASPKQAPPLPHSEQAKFPESSKTSNDANQHDGDSTRRLEKPTDLPDKTHDGSIPVPNSALIDHLDVSHPSILDSTGSSSSSDPSSTTSTTSSEGIIQPLHSFVLALTMILFSEIGDKTFLVAALMAMKHDRIVVFSAAFSALIAMTVLSAILGHAVPAFISERVTHFAAATLFFSFGFKLLREGMAMSPDEGVAAEMQEVEAELVEKEDEFTARKPGLGSSGAGSGRRRSRRHSTSPYAVEMGLAGRTSRSKSRFPAPPRSPSLSSPERSPSPGRRPSLASSLAGLYNLFSLLLSPAWVQTFVMTFLGEWGDRSQIATIAMAAGQDYWVVTFGAICGHACCTGVAVVGGRAIAGRVSLKVVTVSGAVAFSLFGVIYFVEALYL